MIKFLVIKNNPLNIMIIGKVSCVKIKFKSKGEMIHEISRNLPCI